jgi:hypothetical protein
MEVQIQSVRDGSARLGLRLVVELVISLLAHVVEEVEEQDWQ